MKATVLFEAFTGMIDQKEEQALVEPIKTWLIEHSESYVADDDDDLRVQALENTDLVEPS